MKLRSAALALAVVTAAACASVKPWQREHHARRPMVDDKARGEKRFEQHVHESREGAAGGTGDVGGGCGCN